MLNFGEIYLEININIIDKNTANVVVTITDELKILVLSISGKNLITEKSKPSLESITIRFMEEIKAVAIPTSSLGYNFAASIQKMKPNPAEVKEVNIMKNEFL
jgi:hypothetical protein